MQRAVSLSLLILVIVCTAAIGLPAGAATQLTIDDVAGLTPSNGTIPGPLDGPVTVKGTADIDEAAGRLVDKGDDRLVADAGDSPFVEEKGLATLLGTGFGGTAPYSFRWSTEDGKLIGPDAATAQVNTKGLDPGQYTASLRITDAKGATATDTVEFVVYPERDRTEIFNETEADNTPGTAADGSSYDFPFTVEAGLESITVNLTWANPANDYDLEVLDPDGKVRGSSGNGAPDNFESDTIASPAPGEWTIRAVRFATFTELELTAMVEGVLPPDNDPRPVVDAGGSYKFVTGTTQRLDGTVSGGTGPLDTGWDTDGDGIIDERGADVIASLPPGRHFATLRTTDADGLERRETTVILIGSAARIARDVVPLTVVGLADSGINPYHFEFSAETYPDPEVLELTENFTRHPSEYIPGYPADAKAIPITRNEGWFPEQDRRLFEGNDFIQAGALYWIPGTKIIGAIDAGGSTGANAGDDTHPILDDNGHGTGSSSVSTGNRYGYCPTCLLVNVEALDETVVAGLDWVDFSSNSFGYTGGAPLGPIGDSSATKAAAERGQTTLFAAGNGVGNAFDVPISTYGSEQTGPDWNITVGALRREDGDSGGSNQGAITGDGIPAHVSAWGDGNLPSACRANIVSQCAFGGTSAATPYTTGVFGTVLTEIREILGDSRSGQRPGQVVAKGVAVPGSRYLGDGELTRREMRAAVLKTAQPLTQVSDTDEFVYPDAYNGPEGRVVFEGYGAATPNSADRAVAVLLGTADMPARPDEDSFFADDCEARDSLPYGGPYDRDGDGEPDGCDKSESVDDLFKGDGEPTTESPRADDYQPARGSVDQPEGDRTPFTYFLHRGKPTGLFGDEEGNDPDADPDDTPGDGDLALGCADDSNAEFATRSDLKGDTEPCYGSRQTSIVASFRPLGIWASTDRLEHPLPTGSTIKATVYLTMQTPSPAVIMRARMSATDRVLAEASTGPKPVPGFADAALCQAAGEACWTPFEFEFTTKRPAVAGEQVTFSASQTGTPNWAYGYEGEHRSVFEITPAAMPKNGLEFGVTITRPVSGGNVPTAPWTLAGDVAFPDLGADPKNAGFHPTVEKVQVSVDDPDFNTIYANVDATDGRYTVPMNALSKGVHTVYVRAVRDGYPSEVAVLTFNVGAGNPLNKVQWQVVSGLNAPASSAGWRNAVGVADYQFGFDADSLPEGPITIHTRTVQNGAVTATAQVTTTVGGVIGAGAGRGNGPTLPATGTSLSAIGLALLSAGVFVAVRRRRG